MIIPAPLTGITIVQLCAMGAALLDAQNAARKAFVDAIACPNAATLTEYETRAGIRSAVQTALCEVLAKYPQPGKHGLQVYSAPVDGRIVRVMYAPGYIDVTEEILQ